MDEFSWAIGLYEGEGCAYVEKGTRPGCRITVTSTDLDVLERFCVAVGCGLVAYKGDTSRLGKKPIWEWRLSRQEQIGSLLQRMMPHLSQRRQKQAQRVLDFIGRPRLSPNGRPYLDAHQIHEIRQTYADGGTTLRALGELYGVGGTTIHNIIRGKTHASV
jgi:hypothetical protein